MENKSQEHRKAQHHPCPNGVLLALSGFPADPDHWQVEGEDEKQPFNTGFAWPLHGHRPLCDQHQENDAEDGEDHAIYHHVNAGVANAVCVAAPQAEAREQTRPARQDRFAVKEAPQVLGQLSGTGVALRGFLL